MSILDPILNIRRKIYSSYTHKVGFIGYVSIVEEFLKATICSSVTHKASCTPCAWRMFLHRLYTNGKRDLHALHRLYAGCQFHNLMWLNLVPRCCLCGYSHNSWISALLILVLDPSSWKQRMDRLLWPNVHDSWTRSPAVQVV
jgi:hypothetical protein